MPGFPGSSWDKKLYIIINEWEVTEPEWLEHPVLNCPRMTDPIFQSNNTYALATKLMDLSALRQEAIGSNIANAETPGYKRIDVAPDFANQLKAQLASGSPLSSLASMQPSLAQDTSARTVRPDGNSVDIEHELLSMNKNSVEFGYLSDVVSTNIKQLKMAISGNVS
jgi:flagellar basal-body rod protein FlgB